MNINDFSTDAKLLKSAAMFVSKNKSCPHLCGVSLTTDGRIIGVDGHRLFSGKVEMGEDFRPPLPMIAVLHGPIPASAIVARFQWIEFDGKMGRAVGNGVITFTDDGLADAPIAEKPIAFTALDVDFPGISATMREPAAKEVKFAVNAKYLAEYAKAFPNGIVISLNPDNVDEPLVITATDGDRFNGDFAVLMPIRLD